NRHLGFPWCEGRRSPRRGRIVRAAMTSLTLRARTLELAQGDITLETTDAIVNAANSSLLGGGGVDGAIHRRGGPAILEACRAIRRNTWPDGLPTGRAAATTGGALPAKWVIHTVGPVYSRSEDRSALLASCHTEALRVADE